MFHQIYITRSFPLMLVFTRLLNQRKRKTCDSSMNMWEDRRTLGLFTTFWTYTHDCSPANDSNLIVKFADDTTVVGLISKGDETAFREEVQNWCTENNLALNAKKTKEIMEAMHRPSLPLHQRPVRGEGPHLPVSWCSHLRWYLLEWEHHSHQQEGPAATTLPKSTQEVRPTAQSATDLLPSIHWEPADKLYHGMVWQLHQGGQREAYSVDHWVRDKLPFNDIDILHYYNVMLSAWQTKVNWSRRGWDSNSRVQSTMD